MCSKIFSLRLRKGGREMLLSATPQEEGGGGGWRVNFSSFSSFATCYANILSERARAEHPHNPFHSFLLPPPPLRRAHTWTSCMDGGRNGGRPGKWKLEQLWQMTAAAAAEEDLRVVGGKRQKRIFSILQLLQCKTWARLILVMSGVCVDSGSDHSSEFRIIDCV